MQSWVVLYCTWHIQSSLYFGGYYWLYPFYFTWLFTPDVKRSISSVCTALSLESLYLRRMKEVWQLSYQRPPVVYMSCCFVWQWVGLVDVMGSPWPVTIQTPSLSPSPASAAPQCLIFVHCLYKHSAHGFSESRIVTLLNDSGTFSRQTFRQQFLQSMTASLKSVAEKKNTNKSALGSEHFISWRLFLANVSLIQTMIDLFTRTHCELPVSHIINTSTQTSSVLTGWATSFEQLAFPDKEGQTQVYPMATARHRTWLGAEKWDDGGPWSRATLTVRIIFLRLSYCLDCSHRNEVKDASVCGD